MLLFENNRHATIVMKTNSVIVSEINLTLAEQVELGRRMTLFDDQDARDKLILNCVPVVKNVAGRFSKHKLAAYDDLFQEGMAGVMEAIGKYDYTKNIQFVTFAYTRIIHKIARWINKQIQFGMIDNCVHSTNGLIMDTTIDTFQELFRSCPTDTQLSSLLSISVEDVSYLRKHYSNPVPSAFRAGASSRNSDLAATGAIVDASTIVERTMCNEYNRKHIFKALSTMEELEREIILRRYLYRDQKATLEELAKEYNVSASTVLRRERNALNMISHYFKENGIKPEF